MLSSTKAVASVAWPQSSTSIAGVNQRRFQSLPSATTNAVSLRLFSAAIDCINSVGRKRSSRITAAGLPANTRSAKASTM